MKILDLMIQVGDDVYYSKSFMDVLESHMDYFRKSRKSNVVQVDQQKAYVYEGDFFSFLNDIGIEQQYHWVIMRVNNMFSNFDFAPGILQLTIPDKTEIEQIKSSHISTSIIKN